MLLCKSDTVILILLQSGVKLTNCSRPTEVSRQPLRTSLFIRLKTDTFGHAVLQHSLLQVGAQVVYLLRTWHSVSPQLERCGDRRKFASYLKNMKLLLKITLQWLLRSLKEVVMKC